MTKISHLWSFDDSLGCWFLGRAKNGAGIYEKDGKWNGLGYHGTKKITVGASGTLAEVKDKLEKWLLEMDEAKHGGKKVKDA